MNIDMLEQIREFFNELDDGWLMDHVDVEVVHVDEVKIIISDVQQDEMALFKRFSEES